MGTIKEVDESKVVDLRNIESVERLRSLFPGYQGTEFLVIPVDRSMDFSTKEVTAYNTAWLNRHHSEDVW
jgi:hypothetical protein